MSTLIVDNKDLFLLAVAMGLNNPTELKKREGLTLFTSLKTPDRAMISSVLLGTITDENDVDRYADFEASVELCEKCAESGYRALLAKYNDAGCDEELFERRMIMELEKLYAKNVEAI